MTTLSTILAAIPQVDDVARRQAQDHIDGLVKPPGSLGRLEQLAAQLAAIYHTPLWRVNRQEIVVMAADHGVFAEDVAVTPQSVTALQAFNTTRGLTGVCALARTSQTAVSVVDVGIDADPIPGVQVLKVRRGSGNIAREAAMTRAEAETIMVRAANYAQQRVLAGVNVMGVGELGIANTTPAAAIVSVMTDSDPHDVTGLGANYPSHRMAHKVEVIERAIECNQPDASDPLGVMAKIGGYDLAGMTGLMLGAAVAGVPVVLDGFLSYASALIACALAPDVRDYLVPSHCSAEKGATRALDHLGLKPYLFMEMRLGEGSGAALAMNLILAAQSMMHTMGTLANDHLILPQPS